MNGNSKGAPWQYMISGPSPATLKLRQVIWPAAQIVSCFRQKDSQMHGNILVVANRFFPSSKMCSSCGIIKKDLSLKERVYTCDCGISLDRDLNAALTLRNLIEIGPARS